MGHGPNSRRLAVLSLAAASLGCGGIQDGVVKLTLDQQLSTVGDVALYSATLALGTPELPLQFGVDTGSANLLVGTHCEGCSGEGYDPAGSNSASELPIAAVPLSFSSAGVIAEGATARLYQDVMTLPGQPATPAVTFGVIDEPSPYPLLIGLAGADVSELPVAGVTAPAVVREVFASSLASGLFALSLCGPAGDNTLELGIAMPADAQVVEEQSAGGFYTVDISLRDMSGRSLGPPQPLAAVLDSGTPYVYLPAEYYQAIVELVAPALEVSPDDPVLSSALSMRKPIALTDEALNALPTIVFDIAGGVSQLVEPRRYFRPTAHDGQRFFGFAAGEDDDPIVGLTFLEGRATVFDPTRGQIGFVSSSCEG